MSPSSPDAAANRSLRDVIALSTLPAMWLGAEAPRVAESLAAALYTTVGAEVVFIAVKGGDEKLAVVAQTDRYITDAALAAQLEPLILEWIRGSDPEEFLVVPGPRGLVRFAARPLGENAESGVVAVGFPGDVTPDRTQLALLSIGAVQATWAVRNAQLLGALRKAAIENARLVDDLRTQDRRKNEFLATLSHELRNPLAPLRHALSLAGENPAPQTYARLRSIMERQVGHLVRLVDDLLEVSRITHGTIDLRTESFDIRDAIRNAVEASEPLVAAGKHTLEVHCAAEPLIVRGDPVRLAQVFSNLLNNSARYTDPGGRITIEAARDGSFASVAVSDTGIGLAAEDIERIFSMFTQIERKTRYGVAGLGIGLALVKSLVELHGGTVHAQSPGRGCGSRFVVRLPLVAMPAHAPANAPAPARRIGQHRVLVVDDNSDAAECLAMLMEMLGAEVRMACDGAAGLHAFDTFAPDIVILDIGMPGMDGHEVARAIRSRPGGNRARLVALTGWGQEEDRRRALESGFDHHLTKPAELSALQDLFATPLAERITAS